MAKEFSIELIGLSKVRAAVEQATKNAVSLLASELVKEAEGLITEAKRETPVDTGALRASGHVQPPVIRGDSVSVQCGFGGPAAGYAIIVHENLEAHHPIGKAKYLEDPFKRRANSFSERIGAGVRGRFSELK